MRPCSVCRAGTFRDRANGFDHEERVYVAASLRGKCYHAVDDCRGLRSAGGVISVPKKDATERNMRPCSICFPPPSMSNHSTDGRSNKSSFAITIDKNNNHQYHEQNYSTDGPPNYSSVAKKIDFDKHKNDSDRKKNEISCSPSMASVQGFITMPKLTWLKKLPFLAIYEIWRLYNNGKISEASLGGDLGSFATKNERSSLYQICSGIHKTAKTRMIYRQVLRNASNDRMPIDRGVGAVPVLAFSARLVVDERKRPKLVLSTTREAPNRRIYRKFGSHRFLDVRVPRDIRDDRLETLVRTELWIAERRWSFLWSKKCESPQVFVFFAEEGRGIGRAERISAQDVLNWCIPRKFNPGLSVDTLDKRMKLSFSTTVPSGVLPPNSVSKVDDIVADSGDIMTDGCGLISAEALDFIWTNFKRYQHLSNTLYAEDCSDEERCSNRAETPEEEEEETATETKCPYTSFQGRIGGLKGMWVLDPSLEGFRVKYRDSQKKYNLPQRCSDGSWESGWDAFYDTVDVCDFDSKPNKDRIAHLNVRAVQVLEHRGVSFDYFQSRVEIGIQDIISIYSGDNNKKLISHLDKQGKR